uniref:Uncharacterized protein n=1 Tax=Ditylenchus dipsaci TaxID=166011 RepID=A0A915DC96_9BILA
MMSESVDQVVVVAAGTTSNDDALVESKVDEINEKNLSLDALKCAIEAIGDAMAELAETSAVVPTQEQLERENKQDEHKLEIKEVSSQEQASSELVTNNNDNTSESVTLPPQQPTDKEPDTINSVDVALEEPVLAEAVVLEVNNIETKCSNELSKDQSLGEDMCESGFENALSQAMSVKREITDDNQTEQIVVVAIQQDGQLDDHRCSIDTSSMSTSLYEEIEVEEEIEVDDDDTNSQVTVEGEEKPKKKKKLRIMKKIRRAPGKLAYGALFSMGALVGGSIVGSQAIGHGVVDGGKASGAGFVADTTVKFAEGTRDIAKKVLTSSRRAKAGGDFVVETGGKIVDGTKETAVNFAKATSGAVSDSANAALYGVGAVVGGTLAVGQGMVDGTKAIGHGVVDGTKAIGHGVVDSTKAGAKQTLVAAVEATQAGAQYAGYGKQQGNPLAIESDKSAKKT